MATEVIACTFVAEQSSGGPLASGPKSGIRLMRAERLIALCWSKVGAMIITPTRELARQVSEVAAIFCKTIPWLKQLLLTGGS